MTKLIRHLAENPIEKEEGIYKLLMTMQGKVLQIQKKCYYIIEMQEK